MAIIQQPDALSMSGNMKKFIVSSGSQIVFELKEGITTLLSATYEPGVDGRATIDVKDIIENRLSYTLSHNNFYEQTEIVKTFTAIIDGSSHTFKVIRAGIANLVDTVTNWLRGNFLTWQPTNKQITYYSPEWITYYAQEACTVKLKATFPDAEQTLITLGSCVAGKAFTFNLQYAIVSGLLGQKYPTHYDVWVENLTGTRLTYIQRYLYTEQKSDLEQWFLFENSLGGLDTIRTSGDTDFTGEYDHKLSSTDNISKEYLVDTKRVYNQNTGYLDDYERRWLLDFFPAIQKYIYHVSAIRRIVVSDSDVKYSAAALPSSYNFSYHFTEENEAALLNLIRNQQDIPSSITIPNLDSPDFHLPPRLSEYPRVPLHEGVILPAFDPNSDTPKITTLGAIIAKSIEELLENIPGSDGTPGSGGQMVNIVREDDVSSGDDNTVYSSLRTLKEIQKTLQNISDTLDHRYLSKIDYDTAQKIITFIEGIEVGDFSSGPFGSGAAIKNIDGVTVAEVDQLKVRMRAEFLSVLIHNAKHIGGELIVSAADMICIKVEEFSSFYRCYFDRGENNEVNNLFTNLDRARCQVFTGSKQKFYWRKILAVGNDYIELSKTDMAPGDNDVPEVGDIIYQLGSDDPERQGAMIFSTVGIDAPSWKQYAGINSFSLDEEKILTKFTRLGNKIQGKTVFTSGGSNLDDYLDETAQDIQDTQAAANAAALLAQQAIDDAEANVGLINTEVGKLQAQIDGEVSNWFYAYSPTLVNYPASDWTTNEIKDRHIGDTFTNTAQAPATDAGKSWRFVKNGSVYSWTLIADSDAVLALQKAAQAQSTADGKSTTFLIQPTSYKFGDMWVLAADQTVNGVTYKSGEILTATQDSTTFVQAHWVKRVRYTDDTAVNNLEIGGVNLINGNTESIIINTPSWTQIQLSSKLVQGKTYILGGEFRIDQGTSGVIGLNNNDLGTSFQGLPLNTPFVASANMANRTHFCVAKQTGTSELIVSALKVKLEEGNKKTTWSQAPEYIQSRIEAAKQEALNAAGNAQTSANTAQASANALKNFTDIAFTDGVIDRAEAKAIEKYLNTLNETMSKAQASYQKVFLNTYLESGAVKTALENAKINLWGKRDTLLSAINTAISGGITTPTQKTAVDTAFANFNTDMTAFQNALEEANKAIQAKLDALSTEKVNNLKIGVLNTYRPARYIGILTGAGTITKQSSSAPRGFSVATTQVSSVRIGGVIRGNGKWTVSLKITSPVATTISVDICDIGDKSFTVPANTTTLIEHTVYVANWSSSPYNFVDISNFAANATSHVDEIMVVEGDKAPQGYIESFEEVRSNINSAQLTAEQAQLQADGYMRARYVRDWVKGNTSNNLNQWGEIKIINKSGVNIALGKIATTNGDWNPTRPASAITDDNISNNGATNEVTPVVGHYAQLDLGQIYYDIDSIQVWHPYADGRTYFGTKTEISEDGINWTTVFDSAIEGTYTETADGKIHTQRYASVISKLNQSKAITDKFGTTIDNGLVATVLLLLREYNSTQNTSGLSGIQKDANGIANQPSYWSGGTHEQAQAFVPFVKKLENEQSTSLAEYNNLPSIVFLHNGAAKIGHFIVLTSGEILIIDPATGTVKLKFTTAELTPIADLVLGTNSQGSTPVGAGSASKELSQIVSGSTLVSKSGATATFDGVNISINGTGMKQPNGVASFAEATLYARRNGVRTQRLASVTIYFTSEINEYNTANINAVPYSFPVDAGTYTFELVITTTGLVNSANSTTGSSNFSWKHTVAGVKKQQYSKDGMMFFYSNRHFYFNELTGLDVKESAYNKFEMPGVLAAGSVSSDGVQTNVWGAKSSPAGAGAISGGRSVPLANMKHGNYVVQITPHTATTFRVGTKTISSFQAIGTGGFDYVVIGNNY